ncbi:MAG: hypothetical protein ACMXYD_04855 [Candidatus Woesearchaeota archaeon]
MILFVLGILDFFVALILLTYEFSSLPSVVGLYAASYLLVKNAVFYQNAVSYVDGLIGLYLLGMVFLGFSGVLTYFAVVFLLCKVFLSVV